MESCIGLIFLHYLHLEESTYIGECNGIGNRTGVAPLTEGSLGLCFLYSFAAQGAECFVF